MPTSPIFTPIEPAHPDPDPKVPRPRPRETPNLGTKALSLGSQSVSPILHPIRTCIPAIQASGHPGPPKHVPNPPPTPYLHSLPSPTAQKITPHPADLIPPTLAPSYFLIFQRSGEEQPCECREIRGQQYDWGVLIRKHRLGSLGTPLEMSLSLVKSGDSECLKPVLGAWLDKVSHCSLAAGSFGWR